MLMMKCNILLIFYYLSQKLAVNCYPESNNLLPEITDNTNKDNNSYSMMNLTGLSSNGNNHFDTNVNGVVLTTIKADLPLIDANEFLSKIHQSDDLTTQIPTTSSSTSEATSSSTPSTVTTPSSIATAITTESSASTEITTANDSNVENEDNTLNITDCESFSFDRSMDLLHSPSVFVLKKFEMNITVEDLRSTSVNESTLFVSWKAPKNVNNITGYIIEWGKQQQVIGSCKNNNETFNFTMYNLESCTVHDISVQPFSKNNETNQVILGKKLITSDTTGLIVSKESLKLKISDNSSEWLRINWNIESKDCVSKYTVKYCDLKECKSVEMNTTNFNATELNPCTEYNFTVGVYGNNRDYGSATISGETDFYRSNERFPAWTSVDRNILSIYWTPLPLSTCVNLYNVTLHYHSKPVVFKETKDNNVTIPHLNYCSKYEVTIIPIDKRGEGGLVQLSSNSTLAPVPSAPKFRENPHTTSNSILITWNLDVYERNNCDDTILTTYCNVSKVLGSGYEGVDRVYQENITKNSVRDVFIIPLTDLSPFTKYLCYGIASNSQGISQMSSFKAPQTLEDVPPSPELNFPDHVTDKMFNFTWKLSPYLPGNLTLIEIRFSWIYKFNQPSWCENNSSNRIVQLVDGNSLAFSYDNGVPYSVYTVTIRASTGAGWGNFSKNMTFETLPGAPEGVSNLSFFITTSPSNENIIKPQLQWGLPCFIYGSKIDQFNITGVGYRENYSNYTFTNVMDFSSRYCSNDICSTILSLKDEYSYTFYVAGRVKEYDKWGSIQEISAMFPAGIPPEPSADYIKKITMDPYKGKKTTTTATLLLPKFSNDNGNIHCYAIIVSKMGYNNGSYGRIHNGSYGKLPEIASWYESSVANFELPYQASKYCDNYESILKDYGNLKAIKFVIGEESETCPELSSSKNEKTYCNGPLKPDTWYHVRMRAFTNGGYRDSVTFTVKTNAELQIALVIGSIIGILFFGIMTTMMLLVRKCSLQAVMRKLVNSDMPGSPVPAPFTKRKFITHCQQLADNPGKLSNEFQLLQTLSVDLQMPTNAACLQANRKKNRYTDILPYDFSRVKLETIDNDPNSDYINASFIKGFSGEEEYIACQGPKEETTYDFWRMIDQYDVKLIVMLTQLIEKNKEKCHQYYPTIRETFTYENMSIRCSMELDYRTYTQRTLILQKEHEKRNIIHLHFKDWPDHDIPEDFDPIINFCQIIRRHIVCNRGLAVIHCSAGIGRTGTLIAIDILLQHIKENRKLDVFGTVYRLRHHRINMVQRESQYAYIYNSIRQVLKNPFFSKTYKPPSVDPINDNNLQSKKKDNSMTNLVSSSETRTYLSM